MACSSGEFFAGREGAKVGGGGGKDASLMRLSVSSRKPSPIPPPCLAKFPPALGAPLYPGENNAVKKRHSFLSPRPQGNFSQRALFLQLAAEQETGWCKRKREQVSLEESKSFFRIFFPIKIQGVPSLNLLCLSFLFQHSAPRLLPLMLSFCLSRIWSLKDSISFLFPLLLPIWRQ